MKNKNFGFTLIELLVVIVIIGILATISTATFSGYFKKSRDTERQSFVRNAQQIIIADQISGDTPDYSGYTTSTLGTRLQAQGYALLAEKNAIPAVFVSDTTADQEFLVFVCKEDTLGDTPTVGDASRYAFVAGTSNLEVVAGAADANVDPTSTTTAFSVTISELASICGATAMPNASLAAGVDFSVGVAGASAIADVVVPISAVAS